MQTIDYGRLMHSAMRGLIFKVLSDIARHGLPGEHHFFITFDTQHDDCRIAEWLHERYPEEMTVVLQHWYDALEVTEDGFSVTLNFGNAPENMYIPFDAILTFVDPSVEFGLKFERHYSETDEGEAEAADEDTVDSPSDTSVNISNQAADVVKLDSFRK